MLLRTWRLGRPKKSVCGGWGETTPFNNKGIQKFQSQRQWDHSEHQLAAHTSSDQKGYPRHWHCQAGPSSNPENSSPKLPLLPAPFLKSKRMREMLGHSLFSTSGSDRTPPLQKIRLSLFHAPFFLASQPRGILYRLHLLEEIL